MKSLYATADRLSLLQRLESLHPNARRQWGRMSAAQMLGHCARALETATGVRPTKQKLIGIVLSPFFRTAMLGEKPFSKNSPTDPALVVGEDCDFAEEKTRLAGLINLFVDRGPLLAASATHSFLGRLTGDEWGRLMYKHLDHHLRQFGM
jgi:hypothetical protein